MLNPQLPKNLDSVALLQPLPADSFHLVDERYDLSSGLAAGTVGTIVEICPPSSSGPLHYVVEFADGQGCGYALATVPAEVFLVLHYRPQEPLEVYA